MGRADRARRERQSRRLTFGRRPAGPASSFFLSGFICRLARARRTVSGLLALVLLLGAGATWAQTAPTVSGIAVVSTPSVDFGGGQNTYGDSENICIRATFSAAVTVTGTPRLKIKMDPNYGEFWADYEFGSGSTTLTFGYTVGGLNRSTAGIAVVANTLQLNGGAIVAAAGGAAANLAHTGLAHDSNHQVSATTLAHSTLSCAQQLSGSGGTPSRRSGPTGSEAQTRVFKGALAAVASRAVAEAQDNIGARLGDAVPSAGLALAGRPVPFAGSGADFPEDAVRSGGSRGMTAGELLGSSAFSLTLGAAKGEPGLDPRVVHLSVWGRGDFGAFAGRPEPGMRYEGETRTGWLGIDARAGRWVAGLAASYGISVADYSFDGGDDPSERGELETVLSALYPYGRWTFANGLELRGLLGGGTGRLRHRPGGGAPAEASDLTMWMASTGLRRKLRPVAGIDLAARGDVSLTRIKTANGPTEIDGLTADSWRLRAGPEASRRFDAGSGRSYTPFLEAVARRDGGDGLTGTGLEIAGGVRYEAPRLRIETRGRWLAAHTEDGAEERGVSVTARMGPGAHGRGLSLSLNPRWGAGTGGAQALWREETPKPGGTASGGNAASIDARTGYGIGVAPYGLLTPFAETGLSGGGDSRRLRLGSRFEAAHMRLGVELAGERRESVAAEPEHLLRLDAKLRF